MPLAWVAVPAAVILTGGAIYLSSGHHPAARPAAATSTSITKTTAPVATPSSLKVEVSPTSVVTHTVRTSVQRVTTTAKAAPIAHLVRSTSVTRQTVAAPAPAAAAPVATVAAPTPGTFSFTAPPATSTPAAAADTTPVAATPAPDAQPTPQA